MAVADILKTVPHSEIILSTLRKNINVRESG